MQSLMFKLICNRKKFAIYFIDQFRTKCIIFRTKECGKEIVEALNTKSKDLGKKVV